MSIYKMIETKNKGHRYFKDKRFIKKTDIPAEILEKLEIGKDIPDEGEQLNSDAKLCLFCGVGCKLTRLVNNKVVYLCEEHYYDKNVGQIAQRVNQLQETA